MGDSIVTEVRCWVGDGVGDKTQDNTRQWTCVSLDLVSVSEPLHLRYSYFDQFLVLRDNHQQS